MNIILLSGGSGTRLWPLSNPVRSKQFIKIFKDPNGHYESMVQRVYRQIKQNDPDAHITIATSKNQVSAIRNQLGTDVDVSVEPCRKDTFPAIALAAAYLADIKNVRQDECVVICPIDLYVDDDYFDMLKILSEQADNGKAKLLLMGIEPDCPSEKYGYIIPNGKDTISGIKLFKEKPDIETAEDFIRNGALWNGGIFACRIQYILDKAHELINFKDYQDLINKYFTLEKISFDYAVVEKEADIQIVRYSGQWKDVGTWNTLTETMEESVVGKGKMDDQCSDIQIINELDIPVLAMGLKNIVIAASVDGVLVCDKERSSYMKPFVEEMGQKVMFAEKSWGTFQVLDITEEAMTIKIKLKPGQRLNYHSHQYRDELWIVIGGQGKAIIDDIEQKLDIGDVVKIPAGCKHAAIAEQFLQLIEIQIGENLNQQDKEKFT